MEQAYHIQITTQALGTAFSQRALQSILEANLRQDRLRGQIGHPEYHFDDSRFAESYAYMERQRQAISPALGAGMRQPAWQAFGRLLHCAQDFYAHSNYVHLWLEGRRPVPPTEQIEPLEMAILNSAALASGRIYFVEALALLGLKSQVRRLLPKDAHAWTNLDTPERGPLFPYALAAAEKRTRLEHERVAAALTAQQQVLFYDF